MAASIFPRRRAENAHAGCQVVKVRVWIQGTQDTQDTPATHPRPQPTFEDAATSGSWRPDLFGPVQPQQPGNTTFGIAATDTQQIGAFEYGTDSEDDSTPWSAVHEEDESTLWSAVHEATEATGQVLWPVERWPHGGAGAFYEGYMKTANLLASHKLPSGIPCQQLHSKSCAADVGMVSTPSASTLSAQQEAVLAKSHMLGSISRSEAIDVLSACGDVPGDFIVRKHHDTDEACQISIMVGWRSGRHLACAHHSIQPSGDGSGFVLNGGTSHSFDVEAPSFKALVREM